MSTKLIGNNKRGLAFVVSAPAGTGKTTLVKMLTAEFPEVVASISHTTRAPRPGETLGIDYHFIGVGDFQKQIAAGDFLEYVELYGTYYGTSKKWVDQQLQKGKHVILTIDTQGARLLRGLFPAVFVFIAPPSRSELSRRLSERRTESEEALTKRLEWAEKELAASQEYDYRIINDELDVAYQVLRSIVIAEEHRVIHQPSIQ